MPHRILSVVVATAIAVWLTGANSAFAQVPDPGSVPTPGTGTGSGGTGSDNGGTGSGTGGTGTGGSTGGSGGSGGENANTEGVGQTTGDERFVRGNRSTTDFVGADTGDNNSLRGGADADSQGGRGGANSGIGGFFNQLFGGGGVGGFQQQGQSQNTGPQVRVRLTPAIEYFGSNEIDPHGARIEARLSGVMTRYSRNPHLESVDGVSLSVADRVATIRGSVNSPRQKELLEGLLKLEPGISSVENELIITDYGRAFENPDASR